MQTEIITKLEAHIASECKAINREERFDAMLDEVYSFESVGGPFASMSPSRVLKECDPIAHRCGVNDYGDGEGWVEVSGEDYESDDVDKARAEFVEGLESEISDLETEIEDLETDEEHDASELAGKQRKLAELQTDLKAVEAHSF